MTEQTRERKTQNAALIAALRLLQTVQPPGVEKVRTDARTPAASSALVAE